MKIEFSDPNISEFKNGNIYFKNNGQPFDVPVNIGADLVFSGVFSVVKEVKEPEPEDQPKKKENK